MKGFFLHATQSEVLPKSFEQNSTIQKAFPPLPFYAEWGSDGMNNAHTLNRPTDSRAIVLERRERIGQQVALPLCYHRTPLSAVVLYDLLCY